MRVQRVGLTFNKLHQTESTVCVPNNLLYLQDKKQLNVNPKSDLHKKVPRDAYGERELSQLHTMLQKPDFR